MWGIKYLCNWNKSREIWPLSRLRDDCLSLGAHCTVPPPQCCLTYGSGWASHYVQLADLAEGQSFECSTLCIKLILSPVHGPRSTVHGPRSLDPPGCWKCIAIALTSPTHSQLMFPTVHCECFNGRHIRHRPSIFLFFIFPSGLTQYLGCTRVCSHQEQLRTEMSYY